MGKVDTKLCIKEVVGGACQGRSGIQRMGGEETITTTEDEVTDFHQLPRDRKTPGKTANCLCHIVCEGQLGGEAALQEGTNIDSQDRINRLENFRYLFHLSFTYLFGIFRPKTTIYNIG